MEETKVSLTVTVISAWGILRTTSRKSLPGSTTAPSSAISASTVVTMLIAPSEQVSSRPRSMDLTSTPSRMGWVVRLESARATTLRPESRVEVWQENFIDGPSRSQSVGRRKNK